MSNLKNKYFKYKSKYLKIKKQIGGAKLTDLAQTNPDFRSWCRSLLEEKKSIADKLAEFEELKKLIDINEHIQIYEFLERGGKTPYWIELSLKPIVVSTSSALAASSVPSPATAAIIRTLDKRYLYKPEDPMSYFVWYTAASDRGFEPPQFLKSGSIDNLYNKTDRTLILKVPSVECVKSKGYFDKHLGWQVFHPFHATVLEKYKSQEKKFVDVDIPIFVLQDKNMWN